MFAYCANNPVNRFDPTGHAFTDFFAVCFGGTGYRSIDVTTDGSSGSEALAEYVQNYIIPDNAFAASIGVTQNDDRYYHVNTATHIGAAATVIGGFLSVASKAGAKAIVAYPPCAPYVTPFIAGSTALGEALTYIGVATVIVGSQAALPDGSYEQYSVVASWTTVTQPVGFPNVNIYTTHYLSAVYVWNYGIEDSLAYWYLLEYEYSASSKTFGY